MPGLKRSGIGIIAEFCGILNGFPNQVPHFPPSFFVVIFAVVVVVIFVVIAIVFIVVKDAYLVTVRQNASPVDCHFFIYMLGKQAQYPLM